MENTGGTGSTCNIYYSQDVLFWLKGKQEIEIVDFLLRVKRCLVSGHDILASGCSVPIVECHKTLALRKLDDMILFKFVRL